MKKYFLGITAIVLAISASAFTTVRTNTLYKFNAGDIADAASYTQVSTPPSGCTGTTKPCYLSVSGDLQSWLDARTDAQIVADAAATRN